jgi:dTDP-4-amino-4,6-dideoxygalactose transaminase
MVPFVDLKAQYRSIKAEVNAAISSVLESGQFLLGDEVAAFEDTTTAWTVCRVPYCESSCAIWRLGLRRAGKMLFATMNCSSARLKLLVKCLTLVMFTYLSYPDITARAFTASAACMWSSYRNPLPIPVHLQNTYANPGYGAGDFPITEDYSKQVLSLQMFPELAEEQVKEVAMAIRGTLPGARA